MRDPIKLILVDDHQLFLEGMASMLTDIDSCQVVGKALGVDEAITLIPQVAPGLVITDLNMPDKNGLVLIRHVKQTLPEIKVIVLTMHHDWATINQILMAEAEGYLLKNADRQEFVEAINRVYAGGTYYAREIMSIIMESYKFEKKQEEKGLNIHLTEREKEILQLIADEKTSDEIAQELSISKGTVDTHRKNIIKKTNTKNVVGLLKYSYRTGLVSF